VRHRRYPVEVEALVWPLGVGEDPVTRSLNVGDLHGHRH
jgi:hypothetical protein